MIHTLPHKLNAYRIFSNFSNMYTLYVSGYILSSFTQLAGSSVLYNLGQLIKIKSIAENAAILYIKNINLRLKFDFPISFLTYILCKMTKFIFQNKYFNGTLAYLFKSK